VTFVYFLYASRGAGKTTFLLQVCSFLVSMGKRVVFFTFDESIEGIKKKCSKYNLNSYLPHFVSEHRSGVIERTLLEHKPDFVIVDSLQTLAEYNRHAMVGTLFTLSKKARKRKFALVVIGEKREQNSDYLGPTGIGHIVDVLVKMDEGLDGEVVISTPNKNRDTDDKTSRCFFQRTPDGLREISEAQTGYRHRHKEESKIGLTTFVGMEGREFILDEITAASDKGSAKASLSIVGMSNAKAKNLLMVLENGFLMTEAGFVLTANRTKKLLGDAELACVVSVLSLLYRKPIPIDTVFIGGVDNHGCLLQVEGMERRVRRAKDLGYRRIIGPRASGMQNAVWEEADTIKGVWQKLGFAE